ncbi:hypothetical protein FKP32DRAFT_1597411 [Trametes sanguinea]|nr:hypothetical protein FKP32DRAFT_1597411 [Trametes sanguinea]
MAQSFTAISADGRRSLAGTTSGFNSEVEDDEIDQLDSASEDRGEELEPEVEEEEVASTAKGRRKLGMRVPGHSLLPQDKVDNILDAEGAGAHMSKEAAFIISVATEEFIKKLTEAGYKQSASENRQHIQYRDLATITRQRSEFQFLHDTIPTPITIVEAMARRAAREREMLADDPAISAGPPSSPPLMPSTPSASTSISIARAKPKVRHSLPAQPNGKQKVNGSVSAADTPASASTSSASAAARQRYRDSNGRWRKGGTTANGARAEATPSSTGTRAGSARIRNRSARAREAAEAAESVSHASHQNGAHPVANGRSASSASMHQDLHASPGSGIGSTGQFTGPASGYLDDGSRLSANGRSSITDNPGRTIYSQQRPAAEPR